MNKKKSFKQAIFQLLIILIIVVVTVIGLIFIYNLYNNKVSTLEHNQTQVLKQVEFESNNLLKEIDAIAYYLDTHYELEQNILKNIVETNANISSIMILDKEGIVKDFYAMSNLNTYKGFDYSNKIYFKKITENQKVYWSNIFLSTINEEPTISYSFELEEKIGVIFIELKSLADFVKRFKNSDASHMIRMFDVNGIMIINPDRPDLIPQRYNAISSPVFTELINKSYPYELTQFKSPVSNVKNYGMYAEVEATGWKIIIRQNYDLIMQSLFEIFIVMCFLIALFILVASYFTINLLKKMFKAFDDLEQTAKEIAHGDYDIKVKEAYYSEFNTLLQSFESMKNEIDTREGFLEDSLNSFKALVDSTMEAIVIHDNGVCKEVNSVALKLFGYDNKEEMIGKKYLDLFSASSQAIVEENLDRDTEPYEIDIMTKEGNKISALGRGKFLTLQGKKIKVSALIDISELKHKDQLLFQQSKMAAMGEMLENIAHQWRQPLSTISTNASGLQVKNEFGFLGKEEIYNCLEEIIKTTKYLSDTINDFRNFFKSDKEEEIFEIHEVIEQTFKLLHANFKNENINVIKHVNENLCIKGYPNELTQALINILNNAKDALSTNKIKKKYVQVVVEERRNKVIIEIKDNGGGIADSAMAKLFEPYFTTKHKTQGTGIGLYMTHQIVVDHMKGRVYAQNCNLTVNEEVYKSACFIIEFDKADKQSIEDYII